MEPIPALTPQTHNHHTKKNWQLYLVITAIAIAAIATVVSFCLQQYFCGATFLLFATTFTISALAIRKNYKLLSTTASFQQSSESLRKNTLTLGDHLKIFGEENNRHRNTTSQLQLERQRFSLNNGDYQAINQEDRTNIRDLNFTTASMNERKEDIARATKELAEIETKIKNKKNDLSVITEKIEDVFLKLQNANNSLDIKPEDIQSIYDVYLRYCCELNRTPLPLEIPRQ